MRVHSAQALWCMRHSLPKKKKGWVLAQIDILTDVPVSKVHELDTTGLLEIEIIVVLDY